MAVRSNPILFRCPECGWQTVWQPRSDALLAGDLPPASCPRCGYRELEAQAAPPLTTLWQRLTAAWRKT